jgi:hypothetical protein
MISLNGQGLDKSRIPYENILTYRNEELKGFLQEALLFEMFELACILRDEISRRKIESISNKYISSRILSLFSEDRTYVSDFLESFEATETSLGEAIPLKGIYVKSGSESLERWEFLTLKVQTRGNKTMLFIAMKKEGDTSSKEPFVQWIESGWLTNKRMFPEVTYAHFNVPKVWNPTYEYAAWNWDLDFTTYNVYGRSPSFTSREDLDKKGIEKEEIRNMLKKADKEMDGE